MEIQPQPIEVPVVSVYAGDDLVFPPYTLHVDGVPFDLVDDGWDTWTASWRKDKQGSTPVPLDVDVSQAAEGIIQISATPEVTAAMGSSGIWNVKAVKDTKSKTFLRGHTTYTNDELT